MVDALLYTKIPNSMTSGGEQDKIVSPPHSISLNENITLANKELDSILDMTTLKRACCRGRKSVKVKIPIPKNMDLSNIRKKDTYKKFNYYEKEVEIPEGYCKKYVPDFTPGSTKCDHFYSVYCLNASKAYRSMLPNPDDYDGTEFGGRYAPDCGCYRELKPSEQILATLPKKCAFITCNPTSDKMVYIDHISRGAECNTQICQQVNQFVDLEAGGNIDIDVSGSQTCGGGGGGGGSQQRTNPDDNDGGIIAAPDVPTSNDTPNNNTPNNNTPNNNTPNNNTPNNNTPNNNTPNNNTPNNDTGGNDTPNNTGGNETLPEEESDNTMLYIAGGGGLLCCCCLILLIVIFAL